MANLFGAIDVGSHEVELKIFELSKKNGIRQLDDIIHLIDLGTDTYEQGRISFAHVAEVKRKGSFWISAEPWTATVCGTIKPTPQVLSEIWKMPL